MQLIIYQNKIRMLVNEFSLSFFTSKYPMKGKQNEVALV